LLPDDLRTPPTQVGRRPLLLSKHVSSAAAAVLATVLVLDLTSSGSSKSGAALTVCAAAPTSAVPTMTVAALRKPSSGNGSYTTDTGTVGNIPAGVAVDQHAHLAPVANYGRSTHRVIATLPPGAYPAGVMADGKLPIADVTNYGDGHTAGAVSVIEPARTTTNAIPLGGRPGAWRQTQLLTPCT